jgi:hypothetical protein
LKQVKFKPLKVFKTIKDFDVKKQQQQFKEVGAGRSVLLFAPLKTIKLQSQKQVQLTELKMETRFKTKSALSFAFSSLSRQTSLSKSLFGIKSKSLFAFAPTSAQISKQRFKTASAFKFKSAFRLTDRFLFRETGIRRTKLKSTSERIETKIPKLIRFDESFVSRGKKKRKRSQRFDIGISESFTARILKFPPLKIRRSQLPKAIISYSYAPIRLRPLIIPDIRRRR